MLIENVVFRKIPCRFLSRICCPRFDDTYFYNIFIYPSLCGLRPSSLSLPLLTKLFFSLFSPFFFLSFLLDAHVHLSYCHPRSQEASTGRLTSRRGFAIRSSKGDFHHLHRLQVVEAVFECPDPKTLAGLVDHC